VIALAQQNEIGPYILMELSSHCRRCPNFWQWLKKLRLSTEFDQRNGTKSRFSHDCLRAG
jgi:hypothetical protein